MISVLATWVVHRGDDIDAQSVTWLRNGVEVEERLLTNPRIRNSVQVLDAKPGDRIDCWVRVRRPRGWSAPVGAACVLDASDAAPPGSITLEITRS